MSCCVSLPRSPRDVVADDAQDRGVGGGHHQRHCRLEGAWVGRSISFGSPRLSCPSARQLLVRPACASRTRRRVRSRSAQVRSHQPNPTKFNTHPPGSAQLYSAQFRPDQLRPDQTRPDQTRQDQTISAQLSSARPRSDQLRSDHISS